MFSAFFFWEVIFIKSNVMIIDTDLENCKRIKYRLSSMEIKAYYTRTVAESIKKMRDRQYTLVIMDVLLSTAQGLEMLSIVKQIHDGLLFILSEQASSAERVLALKCGADDVLNKPYDLEECVERALALMRRYNSKDQFVGHANLLLDTAMRRVSIAGENITMTRKEYEILLYMLTHRKQVLSYEQIYRNVWKEDFLGDSSVINYHIHAIRKKLGSDLIETIYGIGYCIRSPH